MLRTKLIFYGFSWTNLAKVTAIAIVLAACLAAPSTAQQPGQKTFSSPEEASKALVTAAQNNDEKMLLAILGPDGKQIISSGDDAEDTESRANFVHKYQEMHRLVNEPDGTTTLYIGAENWPTPIPIVGAAHSWYFDTQAGQKEILFRRIGENELSTAKVCQELVAAEKEFHSAHPDEFAQKIFSDDAQHNGLYWKAGDGEPQSPIGPLVASAFVLDNGAARDVAPIPFRGYYYRLLSRRGKDVPGGPKSYVANGKMSEGFAFIAYPAEYQSSGVMTFIVSEDGVVYEKDLGNKTAALAKKMKDYNPNPDWQKVEEPSDELAVQK